MNGDMKNGRFRMAQSEETLQMANHQLWTTLSNAGYAILMNIQNDIRQAAPEPGALVLIQAQEIPRPNSTFDSVLLSAMDTCTHIQLARFYFVSSLAATIDFLDFIVKAFPFPIAELRTDHSPMSPSDSTRQIEHRFTLAANRIGIRHSIRDLPGKTLESILRQYFFDGAVLKGAETPQDDQALIAELQRFLFFHNNHRSMPTLDGKTPVEKLRTCEPHGQIGSFDPPLANQGKNGR
ncbi:MAG: hypothetical protein WEB37_12745 [Bacteroidota bacterium]